MLASTVYDSARMCLTINLLLKRKNPFGDMASHRLPYEPGLWRGLGDIQKEYTGGLLHNCRRTFEVANALTILTSTKEENEEETIERMAHSLPTNGTGPAEKARILSQWVHTLRGKTYLCIQENVQEILYRDTLSPVGYDLVMATRPRISHTIILEGTAVALPEGTLWATQGNLPNNNPPHQTVRPRESPLERGVDKAIRELRNGGGGTDGIDMITKHLGQSPRLQSTRDSINAVLDQMVLNKGLYPSNQKTAEAHGVSLRSLLLWKNKLRNTIESILPPALLKAEAGKSTNPTYGLGTSLPCPRRAVMTGKPILRSHTTGIHGRSQYGN